METNEPKKPRKPRQKKVEVPKEIEGLPHFNCPNCDYPIYVSIQSEHVYDHVMSCPECFERMTDHVFSRFVELGVAMNTSFVRQAVKYMDEFLHIKMEEEGEFE